MTKSRGDKVKCSTQRLLCCTLPCLFFPDTEPCVRALIGSVERQHDVVFGHAECNQVIGNPTFSAIVLNPNLVVLEIDVHETVMDSLLPQPTHNSELVVIADGIKDELPFDLAVRWLSLTSACLTAS